MERLTPAEEEALQAIWQTGEGNIKAFMAHLPSELPYTTVASTIKNLEKKGYVTARLLGNAYMYSPSVTEDNYKRKFMQGVVKDYFDSSYKELVNFFVEQKKLSADELKDIITMIEKGNSK